jgi:Flp pilus assembly protein TadG
MRLRNKPSRLKGASAVEMAIVAPVFVALMMGQIEASRLGMVAQLLTTAAREGCRVAVIPGHTQSDVQDRINAVLNGSGIPVGTITPTCTSPYTWDSAPKGTPITVSLSVPYSKVSWLSTPFYLKTANVTASATMSSENL